MATDDTKRFIASLKARIKSGEAEYQKAKMLISSPSASDLVKEAALNMVRLYAVGDDGNKAIGLLSAARQILFQYDQAVEIIDHYEDLVSRLHSAEEREEDSAAIVIEEEPKEL